MNRPHEVEPFENVCQFRIDRSSLLEILVVLADVVLRIDVRSPSSLREPKRARNVDTQAQIQFRSIALGAVQVIAHERGCVVVVENRIDRKLRFELAQRSNPFDIRTGRP